MTPKPVWTSKGSSNRRITFPIGIAELGETQKLPCIAGNEFLTILRHRVSSASKQLGAQIGCSKKRSVFDTQIQINDDLNRTRMHISDDTEDRKNEVS